MFAASLLSGPAEAQPKKIPRIAVGAIGELGETEDNQQIVATLEKEIVALALGEVIATKNVKRALKRAGKPQLFACEGDIACLGEMATTVGAQIAIGAEIGGLGDIRVLHLKVVKAHGKTLRSATSHLDGDKPEPGKLVELLAPKRYRGALSLVTTVENAAIFVDAKAVGKTPTRALPIAVGTHAVRVSHPHYRDDVRFVDIAYGKTTTVKLELVPLDVSRQNLERRGALGEDGPKHTASRPWYGRWPVVVGIGAVVLVGSAALWASRAGDVESDREIPLP